MSKKMVFKSAILNEKIKIRAMKVVAGSGVDSVEVNMEEGTVTAVGDADPVCLAKKLRKLGYGAELVSVGPVEEEKKEAEKEPAKEPEDEDSEESAPPVVYVYPSGYPPVLNLYPSGYPLYVDVYPCFI